MQDNNRENLLDVIPGGPKPVSKKLALFASEPIVAGRVIFLGDSITEMGDWRKVLNDSSVINRGVGGDLTRSVLRRLNDITDRTPSKIFILLGINDIGKGVADSVIADNYLKIIREIRHKSPGTAVYVQSVLPVNPGMPHFPRHYQKQAHILALNKCLAARAIEGNYTFVDIFSLFSDENGLLGCPYTYDGLHLRPAAYRIWADHLRERGYL